MNKKQISIANDMPHLGNIIETYLKEKRIYKSALARKLSVDIKTLIRIRKSDNMSVQWLWNLSDVLKHNFIADVAVQLPSEYSGSLSDAMAHKDIVIEQLKQEITDLKKEQEIYKNLLKRDT